VARPRLGLAAILLERAAYRLLTCDRGGLNVGSGPVLLSRSRCPWTTTGRRRCRCCPGGSCRAVRGNGRRQSTLSASRLAQTHSTPRAVLLAQSEDESAERSEETAHCWFDEPDPADRRSWMIPLSVRDLPGTRPGVAGSRQRG